MENSATTPPKAPPIPAAIPTLDLKAPLKIEEDHADDTPKIDYGEKLFFAGLIFCCFIIVCVVAISFFLTQSNNQTQKVVTVEQVKK